GVIPRCAVSDGSPPFQLRRSFILPLKQLCSSSMALMVNAPPSSFSRPPPDPPPYEYPPLEALSPVAPPEPPDPPDVVPLVPSSDSPFPCGRLFPVVCRSSPCQGLFSDLVPTFHPTLLLQSSRFIIASLSPLAFILLNWLERELYGDFELGVNVVNVSMDRVSVGSIFVALERFLPALEEKPSDICYLLNMILMNIVLPVVSCLELCLFPIFPLVWSELEAQELLLFKKLMKSLSCDYYGFFFLVVSSSNGI
ncbi:LOW QUALITY PROTEIN: hypothetical protein HID58_090166, partial [Brassica napus]